MNVSSQTADSGTTGPVLSIRPFLAALERDRLPDWLIRFGIRRLLRARLAEEAGSGPDAHRQRMQRLIAQLRTSPIAIRQDAANEQHYEVPAEFYRYVLGPQLKYSCCYYPRPDTTLAEAEQAMLSLTADRAALSDGQRILELGCGWGSLSLWMAERFPQSRITSVSNSASQKAFIDAAATRRGLANLEVITADVAELELPDTVAFDRVVSVEMFEHMRNYERLLAKIARWLAPDGKLFVHIFAHKQYAYPFEVRDENDWMARYFFTGGIMPSDDLLLHFQKDLYVVGHWNVGGTHYQRTAEDWLSNMGVWRSEILDLFARTYGDENALKWLVYWRVFFMSCAEVWGHNQGRDWIVSHYLFDRR